MDDAEYDEALAFPMTSLKALDSPELLQNAVRLSADSQTSRDQLLRSLQAIRSDVAAVDRSRAQRVLDDLNDVVATQSGAPISELLVELTEAEARVAGRPRLNLLEEGGDLREVVAAIDELIAEVLRDGRDGPTSD